MSRIELSKPVVANHVLFAEHNMPCTVCWRESAVLNMEDMVFLPCWSCQDAGWVLTKKRRWFTK